VALSPCEFRIQGLGFGARGSGFMVQFNAQICPVVSHVDAVARMIESCLTHIYIYIY